MFRLTRTTLVLVVALVIWMASAALGQMGIGNGRACEDLLRRILDDPTTRLRKRHFHDTVEIDHDFVPRSSC